MSRSNRFDTVAPSAFQLTKGPRGFAPGSGTNASARALRQIGDELTAEGREESNERRKGDPKKNLPRTCPSSDQPSENARPRQEHKRLYPGHENQGRRDAVRGSNP